MNTTAVIGGDAIKDPWDWRDIPLEGIQEPVAIPEIYDPRPRAQKPFVSHQGRLGTCTGHSGQKVKEWQQWKEHGVWVDLSARWVYANNKLLDGFSGEGSYSRVAAKVITEVGVCLEEEFPEINNKGLDYYKDISQAKPSAKETAKFHTSKGYARALLNKSNLQQAIFINTAAILSVPYSQQGWKTSALRPPTTGETVTGHSVCAIGYNEKGYIIEDSKGSTWGDNGYGYLPYTYPIWDAWVVTDIPDEWLRWAKSMPRIVDSVLLDAIYAELLFRSPDAAAQNYVGKDENFVREELLKSIERAKLHELINAARNV